MGITGLIPFLEKSSSKVYLKDLRGSTVAVDTYCWLHKGVFCCAEKLVRGEETDMYLQYCLKYVQMLLAYDIKPILVFDGRHLPAKELTERRRRESRQQSKKRAAELLRIGRIDEARSHMRRCVDVTHEMALRLIRECRLRNVDCVVAPYEADAQMAWLNKVDVAEYIITEDSDLTLFGARKVIFKLDLTGAGLLVEADKLYLSMGCRPEKYTFEKFRRMCILSGCDYLDSLPGIGLAKACKFILMTEEDNMWRSLKKLPQYLKMKNLEVDDEYIEGFLKAEATFKHMFIYNPFKRKMERLYELDGDERYCSNAGTRLDDDEQALQLALGNLNPFTLKKLDNWHPDHPVDWGWSQNAKNIKRTKHKSIWIGNFQTQDKTTNDDDDEVKNKINGLRSCALYFKKVDFISKTIDEDISANIKEEIAKPEESEIFSMYKHEVDDEREEYDNTATQATKRQRCNSDIVNSISPPVSPGAIRHNPFAKFHNGATEKQMHLQKSPRVCENASLLKVLSPKKNNDQIQRQIGRMNNLKRSIFSTSLDEEETPTTKIEVRSRFFAANIKQVTVKSFTPPSQTSPSPPTTAAEEDDKEQPDEISRIESLAKVYQSKKAQLYNSPSPLKPMRLSKCDEINTKQDIDDNCNGVEMEQVNDIGVETTAVHCADEPTQDNPENAIKTDVDAEPDGGILISDDDDGDNKTTADIKTLPMNSFKSNIAARRMGLAKPKLIKSSTKNSAGKTTNRKLTASGSMDMKSQTRLSMFGFQKRPSLK